MDADGIILSEHLLCFTVDAGDGFLRYGVTGPLLTKGLASTQLGPDLALFTVLAACSASTDCCSRITLLYRKRSKRPRCGVDKVRRHASSHGVVAQSVVGAHKRRYSATESGN